MELLMAAGETRADVVILRLQDSAPPGICSHLLNEYPHVKILGVSPDGHEAFLYEVRAQRVPVGGVSVEGLSLRSERSRVPVWSEREPEDRR
jgi:hypothetical protein